MPRKSLLPRSLIFAIGNKHYLDASQFVSIANLYRLQRKALRSFDIFVIINSTMTIVL